MMDITPDTHILESLRRGERLDYFLLIGEAVDNSFDAGAKSVDISIGPNAIVFRDDGAGILPDNVGSLFRLGGHDGRETTRLGQFGIGIKYQAVSAGDILSVDSTSERGRVSGFVDWAEIQRTGKWAVRDPQRMPVAVGAATGAEISIKRLRKAPDVEIGKLHDDVAQRFHPALATGRRISINGQAAPLLAEPKLTDIADVTLQLSGDRSAHVRAGILDGPSKVSRVHVAYEHRVIMPASTLGCGKHTGLNRIYARVTLTGGWHLGRFKNELPRDSQRRELDKHVGAVLRPLLEKCATESMEAALPELARELMDMLPEELSAARPKRVKKPEKGAAAKKVRREPGLVDSAKADCGGPAKTKKPRARILITFDGDHERVGLGAFVPGRPHRIELSKDHRVIGDLLARRDRADAKTALYTVAIALYVDGIAAHRRDNNEPELPFEEMGATFGMRMSRIFPAIDRDASPEEVAMSA